jgi:hypothetical protein
LEGEIPEPQFPLEIDREASTEGRITGWEELAGTELLWLANGTETKSQFGPIVSLESWLSSGLAASPQFLMGIHARPATDNRSQAKSPKPQ